MAGESRGMMKCLREKIAGVSAGIIRCLKRWEKKPDTRPRIVVVHEIALKRKRSSEDLREEFERRPLARHHDDSSRADSSVNSRQWTSEDDAGYRSRLACNGDEHQHGEPTASSDVVRPRGRRRLRGLAIDADILADQGDVDAAVSPTNTQGPYHTPPEFRRPLAADGGNSRTDLDGLHRVSFASIGIRSTTTVSSYIESHERFDSYVDALNDDEAKRCSVHAVLSTDIARLVAELEVLHNRIAMAKMRAAYHRRSIGGRYTRPESWSGGAQLISHTCTCGRRFELRPEQRAKVQRRTWQAGEPLSRRSPSRHSESMEDVMLRHSAGTTLFRAALREGQKKDAGSPGRPREDGKPARRVELSTSFDFRRECQRVARRISPTFAIWRS